jgi:hypothetical protein
MSNAVVKIDRKQLLNKKPNKEWVKVNPYANNAQYIPIERIELLLRKYYIDHRVEVKDIKNMFNGIVCTVRIHLLTEAGWTFTDGVGASQIQTKKGTSPADLANINNNAIEMCAPKAKAEAFKNAAKSLGRIFGSDLNRKEDLDYGILQPMDSDHPNWAKAVEAVKSGSCTIAAIEAKYTLTKNAKNELERL